MKFLALFAALAFAAPCLADPPAEAELPQLSTLQIVSGTPTLPGALPALTPDAAFVAREIDGQALTDRVRLVVGVTSDKPAGTVLANVRFRSDCPNNSQYNGVPAALTVQQKAELREALVAWTRTRHNAPDAPLLSFTERTRPGSWAGNFDIVLDLHIQSSR